MQPGDRIVFYLTKVVQFGGIAEVTGEAYEDESEIGLASEGKPGESFPFRVPTKPVVVPPPGHYVDVREITDLLEKTRRLGPKKLGMAFRGNLHRIGEADYRQIEELLGRRGARGTGRLIAVLAARGREALPARAGSRRPEAAPRPP